jgi:uracil-DNA glycosylase
MRTNQYVRCEKFPCSDVNHAAYLVPDIEIQPETVSIILISEAASPDPAAGYYAASESLFQQSTVQAFKDAGAAVESIQDVLKLGVYLTTAIKCGKISYGIQLSSIRECSLLLEQELALFPRAKVLLLMGDVAIQALNSIAKRAGEKRPIPDEATYKMRGREYTFRGKRIFPSYLQAGPSFFIEKSKRRMIAEDIASALRLVG